MRFPAQLLGLLLLWVPGEDGGEMGRARGAVGSSTAFHVYWPIWTFTSLTLCQGQEMFGSVSMRRIDPHEIQVPVLC